jgi:TorA maturation chaperone TorD
LTRIALADAAARHRSSRRRGSSSRYFIGVGRGEVLPPRTISPASCHERPLAAVRADLARLGIERRPDIYEPEDGIATLPT